MTFLPDHRGSVPPPQGTVRCPHRMWRRPGCRNDRPRCRRRRHAEAKGAGGLVARLSGTGRLADDLYLLAHHEVTGKPHLQPRAAGLGLAGALLAELMLSGKIYLQPDRIMVADRSPPQDGLAQSVLGLVVSEPGQLAARDWLLFLARTAAEDVALRLEQSGYLTRISSRRPWRGERWAPVDSDCAFAPFLRVKS